MKMTANPDKSKSYTKAERFLARAALILLVLILAALFWAVLTKQPPQILLALLFCLMVVPCIFYAFRLYTQYTLRKKNGSSDQHGGSL